MFHARLLELESEILAKEQSAKGFAVFPPECQCLIEYVENEVEVRLGNLVPNSWRGWLTYKRNKDSLIICRGRAFPESGLFSHWRAGLDTAYGLDTIAEFQRGFDISPPQELDHLLLNFGSGESLQVYLWYGVNLAPYKLIFLAELSDYPYDEICQAMIEACTWIHQRPKDMTLAEFLKQLGRQ